MNPPIAQRLRGFTLLELLVALFISHRRGIYYSLMTIAFGHGLAVAPLQAMMAVGALMNGGYLITPTDACLGRLDPARLARVDRDGLERLAGKSPSEIR